MSQLEHRYITVAYQLFITNQSGVQELVEEAPVSHPFQFLTNLGAALESFEAKVGHLNAGDKFDFTLSVDEAYGSYEEERLVEVPKDAFLVDGRFDDSVIFPGNYIPLVNAEGQRFEGLVVDVQEKVVKIDLNSPLAGKELHYVGEVVTAREATEDEVRGFINMITGGGCGCGCGGHENNEGGCGCGGHGNNEGACGCQSEENVLHKWETTDEDEEHPTGTCGCGCHH